MSGDREKVLGRIREALQMSAPPRHLSHGPKSPAGEGGSFQKWLPPVGVPYEEQHALFVRQSQVLKTEFHDCENAAAAAALIAQLAQEHSWGQLALHGGALTDAVAEALPSRLGVLRVGDSYDKVALEQCDAGLTECEALIAQTGSVCVTTQSSGGRALSVLPPHHLVIARRDQLVSDLSAAYELLKVRYVGKLPSFISFISGPSRTGDIERILVLGAHGPKRLSIFLVP
jgi:L-lactate dehydrogenase complex protein LldG